MRPDTHSTICWTVELTRVFINYRSFGMDMGNGTSHFDLRHPTQDFLQDTAFHSTGVSFTAFDISLLLSRALRHALTWKQRQQDWADEVMTMTALQIFASTRTTKPQVGANATLLTSAITTAAGVWDHLAFPSKTLRSQQLLALRP